MTKHVSVPMDEALHERVKTWAAEQGRTPPMALWALVRDALAKVPPAEEGNGPNV